MWCQFCPGIDITISRLNDNRQTKYDVNRHQYAERKLPSYKLILHYRLIKPFLIDVTSPPPSALRWTLGSASTVIITPTGHLHFLHTSLQKVQRNREETDGLYLRWDGGKEMVDERERERVREEQCPCFYPITNQISGKTSLYAEEVFCGIMTKLKKQAFVWKQRGVCLCAREPAIVVAVCVCVCVYACVPACEPPLMCAHLTARYYLDILTGKHQTLLPF